MWGTVTTRVLTRSDETFRSKNTKQEPSYDDTNDHPRCVDDNDGANYDSPIPRFISVTLIRYKVFKKKRHDIVTTLKRLQHFRKISVETNVRHSN